MSQKNEGQSDAPVEPSAGAEALAKVETARMTRRAALSKFGIRAGAAVFAAMNVDTIARMVGVEMQRQGKNGRVADKLAHEFRNAGLAFADDDGGSGSSLVPPPPCPFFNPCNTKCSGASCQGCQDQGYQSCLTDGKSAAACKTISEGCMLSCCTSSDNIPCMNSCWLTALA